MTSVWSNAELLYSMPAAGATASAPGAASVILSGNSTTLPAFKMPSPRALWGLDKLPGKTMGIVARGTFGTPASAPGTWLVGAGLNTTQNTKPTAIVLGATGAFTPAAPNLSLASTAGAWRLSLDITFSTSGVSSGTGTSNIWSEGDFDFGPGNNAATSAGIRLMIGSGAVVAVDPTVEYWVELYATFSTGVASDVIACNQFMVYAQN